MAEWVFNGGLEVRWCHGSEMSWVAAGSYIEGFKMVHHQFWWSSRSSSNKICCSSMLSILGLLVRLCLSIITLIFSFESSAKA